jgi:hypothetical protein
MMMAERLIYPAVFAAICLAPQAARAAHVSLQGPDKVEGACNEKGGVWFPPGGGGSTYGCLYKDGGGIVCGGESPEDKKSCDTWPASIRVLPSRSQVRAAVSASMHTKPH